MMEASQDIVSCYSYSVGWRSDYIINLKKQPKNSRFFHWYCLQRYMKSHEKESIHPISLSCNVSQHFFNWELNQKFIIFDLQLEEESDMNRSLLSSMPAKICFKMLIKWLINHSVNKVFNQRLSNNEVGLFHNNFLNNNWIARFKVCLKLVLNCIDLNIDLDDVFLLSNSILVFWPECVSLYGS